MTDELLEEKKREERRRAFIALYVAEIIKMREASKLKAWKASVNAFFDNAIRKPEESLAKGFEKAYMLYSSAVYSQERRNEFFKLDETDPETAEVKENMRSVGLKESSFAVLAFAAVGEKLGKLFGFFSKKPLPQPPEEEDEINSIKLEAVVKAKQAIFDYKNEKPEIFAKILYGGLRIACEHFATENDSKEAAQWSIHVEDMLELVKSSPVLLKESGLTKGQLRIVEDIAGRGRALREGLVCIEKMSKEHMDGGINHSASEHSKNIASILKMQLSLVDRENTTSGWDVLEEELEKPEEKLEITKEVPQAK